jgi:hypothetical protein
MTTNTAAFTARMDGMDENLAAIRHLLENSIASSSKLADNVQALSAQAVTHNEARFRQGQVAFHRVQDVENLVADFKSASAMVTRTLEDSVPTTLQSVLEQTIPPTLQTTLDDTISPMLQNVLNGTFSEFTSRYESVGDKMVRKVKTTLEKQWESLTMDYSLVQASLQEVLARLCTLERTYNSSPQDRPGSEGARYLNWSHPTRSDHGGDRVPNVSSPHVQFRPEGTSPLAANIDHSPTLEGEPSPRGSSTPFPCCPPTWGPQWQEDQDRKAAGCHHGYKDSQLHVDTSDWKAQGGMIVSPDRPTVLDMHARRTRVILIWLDLLTLSTILVTTGLRCSRNGSSITVDINSSMLTIWMISSSALTRSSSFTRWSFKDGVTLRCNFVAQWSSIFWKKRSLVSRIFILLMLQMLSNSMTGFRRSPYVTCFH